MGGFVPSGSVYGSQTALNIRFAAGDAIKEMVALQKEFRVFSARHDLKASASLLGLAPDQEPQRKQWLKYLDHLKTLPSDVMDENGHDRIRSALQDNLEGKGAPVYFSFHDAKKNAAVTVGTGKPVIFLDISHLVVSVPTENAGEAIRAAVKKAPSWTERKGAAATKKKK